MVGRVDLCRAPEVVVVSTASAGDAGDVDRNLRYLRAALADSLARGEAPYASHGLYTQPGVLDDTIPQEREKGIAAGFEWGKRASVRAVYGDLGITDGMRRGIEQALLLGQRVELRSVPDWGDTVEADAPPTGDVE